MVTMKKVLVCAVLLLAVGTAVFAQEISDFTSSVGFVPKFFTTEADEWTWEPSIGVAGRVYMWPLAENLDLGFSGLITLWIPGEIEYKNNLGVIEVVKSSDYGGGAIFDVGALLGGALRLSGIGPLSFVVEAGVAANFKMADFSEYMLDVDGYYDLEYMIFDVGPGVGAAIQCDFTDKFFVEVGASASYALYVTNYWRVVNQRDPMKVAGRGDGWQGSNLIRVNPAIMFGVKI